MQSFFLQTTKTPVRLAQFDLSLRSAHMSEGTFAHLMGHLLYKHFACWVKFLAGDILKYCSNFSYKKGSETLCKFGVNLHEVSEPIF